MALRQFASRCSKPLWSYLQAVKSDRILPVAKSSSQLIEAAPKNGWNLLAKDELVTSSGVSLLNKEASPLQNNNYIDLFTNNLHRKFYMPTNTINKIKMYQDIDSIPKSINENFNTVKIIDPPPSKRIIKKEAVRMILIRRRKMRKHKLKKLRKRMKFVFQKIKEKRQLRKEQEFRRELLSQVETAEKFDAKSYVDQVLHTIRYHPKPETEDEVRERLRLLKRKNKYQTTVVRPRFDY
ncbi:hypothetical protein AVEN_40513-1 [Araneus ventricosus]|uniref:Ribosomal protein mS38 C-terminal domain-containing protein n=1 Tax=Araneus ventricosus TaxID=182803 RepID=A0A4Y2IP24_ARAVE|nr:hypothetical protein AVEN_40513-1 [Araneus ventricosus]